VYAPVAAPAQPQGTWGMIKRLFKRDAAVPAPAPVVVRPAPSMPVHVPAPVAPVAAPAVIEPAAAPAPVVPVPLPTVAPAAVVVSESNWNRPVAPAPVPAPPPLPNSAPAVTVAEVAGDSGAATGSALRGIEPIRTLSPQEEGRLCGTREDLTVAHLSDEPALRYDPGAHLVTALREAYLVSRKWQVPTRLDTDAGVITVDSVQNRVYLEFSEARLYQLCASSLDKRPKTRTLGLQEAAAIRAALEQGSKAQDLFTCRADATLWRAGMETARGRLPQGVNPGKTIYLKHWPNMTRLLCTPHALRVTALWATRGGTLLETSTQLGVSLRHVLAIYNAALALDLITEDGGHIRRAQRKSHRNRGLLTRLFTWLHK
jgi:hypothetical protein